MTTTPGDHSRPGSSSSAASGGSGTSGASANGYEREGLPEAELYGTGARWRGQLQNYGELSFEFLLDIPTIPPQVFAARAETDLAAPIWAKTAKYSCPALNIRDEVVVISSDAASCLLLQSLLRPDLGRLNLRLLRKENVVHMLVGGDESWTPADEPTFQVSLVRKAEAGEGNPFVTPHEKELDTVRDQLVYAAGHGLLDDIKHMLVQHKDLSVDVFAKEGPLEGRVAVVDFLLTEKKADPLLKSRPKSKSDAEKATSPGTSPTLTTAPSNLYDDAPSGGAAPSSGAAAGPAGAPGTPDKQERAALVAAQSRSPLFFACTKQGNKEIVQILMDAGANAEDGMEPVCMRGDDKMLRVLLNSQISLPVIERWMKKCAKNGHGSCLRLLLGTMPRSYQTVPLLNEALALACMSGKTSSVKILLDMGANPHGPVGEEQRTAFDIAALYEQALVTEILNTVKPKKIGRNVLAEMQLEKERVRVASMEKERAHALRGS